MLGVGCSSKAKIHTSIQIRCVYFVILGSIFFSFFAMAQPSIDQFVENLLVERGMTGVDEAVLAELRADLMERLSERLNAEMVALLDSEKVEELNDLMDADAEIDIVREFFMSNVPNYQDVFARTLMDFRTSYLS